MVHHSGTISFETFETTVVEADWAAQLAGPVLYDEWPVAPAEGDIVEAGVGPRPTTRRYCLDADMFVVPQTFAIFVAKCRPLLQIRRMSRWAGGANVLTVTTFVVPEPDAGGISFRLHIVGASVASLSIPLLGFSEARLKVWWSLREQKGICSVTPSTLTQANGYMNGFMELWKDNHGFIAIHMSVGSHGTPKKPAVLRVHPGGVVPGPSWTDTEKPAHAKGLELVQETEALRAGELVPVCTAMWEIPELTGYWGYYGSDGVVMDADNVFHQFADILLYNGMVVGEEPKPKSRSAMARARKLSKTFQTAAIMKHVKKCNKGARVSAVQDASRGEAFGVHHDDRP